MSALKLYLELFKKTNFINIEHIFNEIPKEYNGMPILSDIQKNYLKSLKYKYNNLFVLIYNKLLNNNRENI